MRYHSFLTDTNVSSFAALQASRVKHLPACFGYPDLIILPPAESRGRMILIYFSTPHRTVSIMGGTCDEYRRRSIPFAKYLKRL